MNTGEEGLNTSEAHDRLERFGRNELEEKVKSKWKVFIGHVRLFPHVCFPEGSIPLRFCLYNVSHFICLTPPSS